MRYRNYRVYPTKRGARVVSTGPVAAYAWLWFAGLIIAVWVIVLWRYWYVFGGDLHPLVLH